MNNYLISDLKSASDLTKVFDKHNLIFAYMIKGAFHSPISYV